MFKELMSRLLLYSAPCRPDIASVFLNCNSSSFSLNWTSVNGAVFYTAVARASTGQNSSCTTNSSSCDLVQLACGQIYSIMVTASNSQCSSNQSSVVQVSSGSAQMGVDQSRVYVQDKCLINPLSFPLPIRPLSPYTNQLQH